MERLTTDELRTICWMCQNESARIAVRKHHKDLDKNETYQRIISISKKAYSELIKRDNEKLLKEREHWTNYRDMGL